MDSATVFYQKAISYAQQTGSRDVLLASYLNLGLVYQSRSDYRQALAYYQKGLNPWSSNKTTRNGSRACTC